MKYSIIGQILNKYYTAELIDYQLFADTLIINLKKNDNISAILPIRSNILLIVMESATFVCHLGLYANMIPVLAM